MANDFASVIAKMQSLTQDQHEAANRKALRAVGKVIKGAVVANAPVLQDPQRGSLPPGALKNDIKVSVHIAKDIVDTNRVRIGPGDDTKHVAGWVENGHALVRGGYSKTDEKGRRGPGKVVGEVKAHPFIRPAADAVKDEAVEAYSETMLSEIAKVMNG